MVRLARIGSRKGGYCRAGRKLVDLLLDSFPMRTVIVNIASGIESQPGAGDFEGSVRPQEIARSREGGGMKNSGMRVYSEAGSRGCEGWLVGGFRGWRHPVYPDRDRRRLVA